MQNSVVALFEVVGKGQGGMCSLEVVYTTIRPASRQCVRGIDTPDVRCRAVKDNVHGSHRFLMRGSQVARHGTHNSTSSVQIRSPLLRDQPEYP